MAAAELDYPAVPRQHEFPDQGRGDDGRGVISHIFPEAEDVNVGIFQYLGEYADHEVGVSFHHLFHECRVVVEKGAEALDTEHVPQRTEKASPPVGDDDQGIVTLAMATEFVAPVMTDALREVRSHPQVVALGLSR